MKKKRIMVLILQLVLVGVSVFLMLNYVNGRIEPIDVFIYNADFVNSTKEITSEDVRVIQVPREAVSNAFALSEEDVVGKYVDGTVKEGQYIYKSQLIEKKEVDAFNDIDLSRMRKISLPISHESAFAGDIRKGDTLDLMYVGNGSAPESDDNDGISSGGSFTYSKVFMSDVLVYSVTSSEGSTYVSNNETLEEGDDGTRELGLITLAVTLEEAEQIQARRNTGQIRFVGRFDESVNYDTLGYVMGEYGKIFSGKAYAETDELEIVEDDFDIVDFKEEQKVEKKTK